MSSGVIEIFFGIDAERKALESVAQPLSSSNDEDEVTGKQAQAGQGA